MMFKGKRGIGLPIFAAAKLAKTAFMAAGKGVKKGSDWGIEGAKNHPLVNNRYVNNRYTRGAVNNRFTRAAVNNRAVNNRVTRAVGGAAGLMGGLALAGTRGIVKSGQVAVPFAQKSREWYILLVPLLLIGLDLLLKKNGIPLDVLWNDPSILTEALQRIVVEGPYWIFLVVYLIIRRPHSREDFLFPAVAILVGLLTFAFGGLNNWIFFHILFAVFTFIFLLKGFDSNTPISQTHWVFLLIFFIDIFGLATLKALNVGILGNIIPDFFLNRLVFPIWFFYYLAHVRDSGVKTGISISIVLFYGIYAGFGYIGVLGPLDIQGLEEELDVAGQVPKTFFENLGIAIGSWFSSQIQYAITGKVEQNEFEPLGVYLDNVESVASRYYIDKVDGEEVFEEVIIYGTVRGRTLDDPINIEVGCFVEKDKKKIHAKLEDPENKFTIFAFEEQDFACTFTENQLSGGRVLKEGSNTITTFADFNFETLAFQKVYFMDRDRLRAMTREGLDVFDEFGIKDKRPVPVYTNGPAAIEMGTTNPLVGVSEKYLVFPRFSLAIKNRPGWQGRITGLKELVLLLPEGVNISKRIVETDDGKITINDCNVLFEDYGIVKCNKACGKFVLKECNEVCDGYGQGSSGEKTSCLVYCSDEQVDCKKQCEFLFIDRNQEYKGYALAQSAIDKLQKRVYDDEDSARFERFNCKLNPIRDEVLGNTPITTKFFRVKARYNYTVEESITVNIVKAPEIEGIDEVPIPPADTPVTPTQVAEVIHTTPSGMIVTSKSERITAKVTQVKGKFKKDLIANRLYSDSIGTGKSEEFIFVASIKKISGGRGEFLPSSQSFKYNRIEGKAKLDRLIADVIKNLNTVSDTDPQYKIFLLNLIVFEWAMEEVFPSPDSDYKIEHETPKGMTVTPESEQIIAEVIPSGSDYNFIAYRVATEESRTPRGEVKRNFNVFLLNLKTGKFKSHTLSVPESIEGDELQDRIDSLKAGSGTGTIDDANAELVALEWAMEVLYPDSYPVSQVRETAPVPTATQTSTILGSTPPHITTSKMSVSSTTDTSDGKKVIAKVTGGPLGDNFIAYRVEVEKKTGSRSPIQTFTFFIYFLY